MFSVVVPTFRDLEALRPLFRWSNNLAELIIIDSHYNEETRSGLEEIKHDYKTLVYAPPLKHDKRFDMMRAINTGICYSGEPWVMKCDDNWEFIPGFFNKACETLERFSNQVFVLRPVELEPWNNDIRWISHIPVKERYINLPAPPLGRNMSIVTIGQMIAPISVLYDLNGWEERYDDGLAWNDNDMFHRILTSGYRLILDQGLMMWRYSHISSGVPQNRSDGAKIFQSIWGDNKKETRTANTFDLKQLHTELLGNKKDFVIGRKGGG